MSDLLIPSEPLRPDVPRVDRVAIIDDTAFVCWPRELVGKSTLTSIELNSGQAGWSREFGAATVVSLRPVDDQLFVVTRDGTEQNEFWIDSKTGEVKPRRPPACVSDSTDGLRLLYGEPVRDGSLFVTNQIYCLDNDKIIREFDFSWEHAVADQGKLYTQGSCGLGPVLGFELRRTDLKTGVDEVAATLPSLSHKSDHVVNWTLLAGRGDIVVLASSSPGDRDEHQLVAFDLSKQQDLWRVRLPCRIRTTNAQFRESGLLECQCHISELAPCPLRPLLVDLTSGTVVPDPEWNDPYSLIHWHGDGLTISFASRGNGRIVATLNNNLMICVDSSTGDRLWKRDTSAGAVWPVLSRSPELGKHLLISIPGGFEVINVEDGTGKVVMAVDAGLSPRSEPSLPRMDSVVWESNVFGRARDDWQMDLVLKGILALPVMGWSLYAVLRRRRLIQTRRASDSLAS